jgi:transposase
MQSVCGIDVSKDRLDIMVLPEQQYFSVRNDAAGWAELVERLVIVAIMRKMITALNAMVRDCDLHRQWG